MSDNRRNLMVKMKRYKQILYQNRRILHDLRNYTKMAGQFFMDGSSDCAAYFKQQSKTDR